VNRASIADVNDIDFAGAALHRRTRTYDEQLTQPMLHYGNKQWMLK